MRIFNFFFKTIMSLGKNMVSEIKKNMEEKIYPVDVTKLYFKYKDRINPKVQSSSVFGIARE